MQLTWLGGPTLAIEFNGLRILTDPMFGDGDEAFSMADPNESFDLAQGPRVHTWARSTPFPGIDETAVDLVVLSHAHEDHFDQVARAQLPAPTPMLVPVADREQVVGLGFERVRALGWGETHRVPAGTGHVEVTALPAHHTENPDVEELLGIGNGYWLEFEDGDWRATMYWTGDTLMTPDVVAAAGERGSPNVMVAHLGNVGVTGPLGQISMAVADALEFADRLKPGVLFPIHHSTYPLYLEPVDGIVEAASGRGYRVELVDVGESVGYGHPPIWGTAAGVGR